MTEIQNLKCFGHWDLEFGIYLLFEYCNLVLQNVAFETLDVYYRNLPC